MLKITCVQSIEYNLQLIPTMNQLSEEDIQKMDIILSEGKANVNFVNRIDGKLYTLNTKKESIVLKRLCRPEIWKQFGFSNIEPEPIVKSRQFSKKYWLYAAGSQCSMPYISHDQANQIPPHGTLTQLTIILNWVTINDDAALLRRKLTTEKQELSLEIAAIDLAFRSLMKNLLSQRYPLIFSPNYQEKLQSITKYIPTISNSIARIIRNSPNDEFRSQTNKHIQETRDRVNLSFPLQQDIKDQNLTSKRIRNILENGLYTIAKDINVPTTSFVEHSSSDEEVLDSRIEEREAAKSRKSSDLKQKTKVTHDVPEADFDVSYQTNDTDYDLSVNLESEDNESLFDNDDMNIIEKVLDVDDVESMFDEFEDNQNLVEEELEQSSDSENYENFWDEEDIQFLFGIKDTTTMNTCNEYTTKFSQKDNIDNDIDLLDYDSFEEEDMHDIDSDLESPNKRNNLNVMSSHLRPKSPFRDKTNDLFQGREIYDSKSQYFLNEKNQDSEDTFFDTMF
ncbi:hypothetical protein GLOIN_2v1615426 [Rhizophagus irregularis DAOM 181602=DAOM 197198]|nr:hypothetical protein GLOIN_2v1615426 [Rhizophagus irregularis DAOM 181602=DAOM 197198]POG70503.1 hypothetical protein GLOIN_2v1615426 [Rhizophagus irregularis DAOM 181602=DAOM 197198]|eukprot:XP_025177369.1 hypothetical protein GLOIN_2v1615426 [Rhizophagus irregularis DAOM 181602=DAOM 197198]